MTIQEAQLFFPYEANDDLDDLFDLRFFEHKQFFLSQPIIRKVFTARLAKLNKMFQAYSILLNPVVVNEPVAELGNIPIQEYSSIVLDAFNQYQNLKSAIFQQIVQASDVPTLTEKVHFLLSSTEAYYSKWITDLEIDVEIERISKEPDSMEILRAIKEFNESGGSTFLDIPKQKDNLVLLKEMKRVSLLTKLNG